MGVIQHPMMNGKKNVLRKNMKFGMGHLSVQSSSVMCAMRKLCNKNVGHDPGHLNKHIEKEHFFNLENYYYLYVSAAGKRAGNKQVDLNDDITRKEGGDEVAPGCKPSNEVYVKLRETSTYYSLV